MNYTINQLRIFLKVVETKSITKAADELFMTQPAVSIQLRNFQDQFKIPLTEHVGRNIQITDFGKEISQIAEKIIEELDILQFKTKEYEGLITGKLKISTASTGKYVIPYFLSKFLNDHSGIDLLLDVTNKSRVIESLKNSEIDFAVVSTVPDDLIINEEILVKNELYLIGNAENHQKEMPLIYREQGSATRVAMENFFKTGGLKSKKRIELTSNEAVKQAVIAGLGHSILPVIGIKNELIDGSLRIIQKKGLPILTEWKMIWLKDRKLSPVAKGFLEFIRAEKERIKEDHFEWYEKTKDSLR